ncbi:MAG: hypothetical protein NWE95_03620 [Candidatus Bathyarchaeota archaeon]|nr:hypothetical protein [Candidatus Bathyarchaeota archaeon]
MKKKFIALACLVFAAGLVLGSIFFYGEFTGRQYKIYPIEANIVHAYFNAYNTNAESGIGYTTLVSYVFVLNVTNPTDTTLRLSELFISSTNLLHLRRDFPDVSSDYYFYPHTSRLVVFRDTTSGIGVSKLELGYIDYIMTVGFSPTEGRGSGSVLVSDQLSLRNISQNEYVYGATFKTGSYFTFNNENIGITSSTGRQTG